MVDSLELVSSYLQKIDFEDIIRQYSNYIDEFNRLTQDLNTNYHEVIKIFNRYKWFVPLEMPIKFLLDLVKISKLDNPQKRIDEHFLNYFSDNNFENLKLMVKKWESTGKFKPKRIEIINDCLNIMIHAENGKIPSTLIVPTLIAQIDGIQREYILKDKFEMKGSRIIHKVNGTAIGQNGAWKSICEDFNSSEDSIPSIINDIILNVLFENVNPGEPINAPITFSRHKIMHGEYNYLDYGTDSNVLRSFIILDFLHDLPLKN